MYSTIVVYIPSSTLYGALTSCIALHQDVDLWTTASGSTMNEVIECPQHQHQDLDEQVYSARPTG